MTSNSTPKSCLKGVPMVKIDKDSHRPFYEQLVIGIKEDILQGILEPGDQIPSVREMAKILLINPNTISKAYKVLESEQVLVTVKGKGTFVKQVESRPRDLRRIEELQQQFNELVIEAKHLQVNETEIKQWLKEAEAKLGGNEA
ncbi:MAG TPA: GntR family transcriptional regulator [Flavobacterium sp.]|nr:GntR family transcriptional regulator [Flavobacterium sp.]